MTERQATPKRRKSGRWRVPSDDAPLMQLISDLGLVRIPEIESARISSERSGEKDNRRPPTEFLIESDRISLDQAKRLQHSVGHVIPTCYRCLKHNRFAREDFNGRFICKHCQSPVSVEDDTAGLGEALLPDPPSRVVDKLMEKLLAKRGIVDPVLMAELKEARKQQIPRPTLVDLLRQKKLITSKRLVELKGKALAMYHKRITFWQALRKDYDLACFLCDLRVCSQRGLSEALIRQLESAMNGQYLPLRQMLVESGQLTEYQIEAFIRPQFDNESYRRALLLQFCDFLTAEDADDLEESDWEDSMAEMVQELHHESSSLHVLSLEAPAEDARSIRSGQAFKAFAEQNLKGINSIEDLKGRVGEDDESMIGFKVKKQSFYSGGQKKKK